MTTDRDPMAGAATNEPIVGTAPPDTPPPTAEATPGDNGNRVNPPPEIMPTDVIEAIRRVMVELPGIGKATGDEHRRRSGNDQGSGERGVNYAYRSIEQITGEAQELFGRYGVVFVPRKVKVLDERAFTMGSNSTRWTDTRLRVSYRIFGPGGPKDYVDVGPMIALGRDNSDKGLNKAMTQAFKQVLLQLLCIGDPKDEGEHERFEQTGYTGEEPLIGDDLRESFRRRILALPAERQTALRDEWEHDQIPPLGQLTQGWGGTVNNLITAHEVATHEAAAQDDDEPRTADAGPPEAPPEPPDPLRERRTDLTKLIEGAPERLVLRSHLIGQFGPLDELEGDLLEAAIAVATNWPPPATDTAAGEVAGPPEPGEPTDTAQEPTGPAEPPAAEPTMPDAPENVVDAARAQVAKLTVPALKKHLMDRHVSAVGTKRQLADRLAVILVSEYVAKHADDGEPAGDAPAG